MFLKGVQAEFLIKSNQAELNFLIDISKCKGNSREIFLIVSYFVYLRRYVYISSSLVLCWIVSRLFSVYKGYILVNE